MKKLSLSFLLVLAFVLCNAQPKIQFDSNTYDFGKVKEEGGKVTGRFEFTNVGTEDLILTNVRPGCGCTAADYSRTLLPLARKVISKLPITLITVRALSIRASVSQPTNLSSAMAAMLLLT